VEFDDLLIVLDDRAGDLVGQAFGKRAAQIVACARARREGRGRPADTCRGI
jgi:hypothetical protein